MKKVLFIITFALTSLLSNAQQDSARFMHSIGFGYQYTQFNGVSEMQNTFGNGYNLDAGAFTMNFACYTIYDRFMLGGEFGGLQNSKASDNNDMVSSISQGFGYFNLGYLIVDKPGCMLYPFVGVGGVYSGLTLKNKTMTDWINDDYMIRSGQKGNFSSIGGSINAGISFRKACNHTHHGKQLQLGLDLGVHITPMKRDWEYNGSNEKVESFGSADNVGYYARFTIGGLMTKAVEKRHGMRM